MSEITPLLAEAREEQPHNKDIYDRFSSIQKRVILAVVSPTGLLSPFSTWCFVPCVPQVAKDLNTTGTVINYTIGVYISTLAIGNIVCVPYAGFYGRRAIYLVLLPVFCVGCLAASMAVNVHQLVIGRTLQAFGASCLIPVGAATVSEVYRLENRGTAMGIFFGIIQLGPALAPVLGGISATYASWRTMQLLLFAMGFMSLASIATCLPETSHPGSRGIDKLKAELRETSPDIDKKWTWVWLNPWKSVLELLRGPTIFFVTLASSLVFMTHFVLMVPLSYTLGPRYGVTSPALIGLCLLPPGIGNIVGATIGGHLADRAIVKGLEERGGKWFPEDRLRAALSGALLLVPLSVLFIGLTTEFIPGSLGLAINLVCLFMNGVGADIVKSPAATYIADILGTRRAEAVAAMLAFRNIVSALASAAVLPTINMIGLAPTNGLVAVVSWLAFGLLMVTIKYGDRLRAWVDIGYTTTPISS